MPIKPGRPRWSASASVWAAATRPDCGRRSKVTLRGGSEPLRRPPQSDRARRRRRSQPRSSRRRIGLSRFCRAKKPRLGCVFVSAASIANSKRNFRSRAARSPKRRGKRLPQPAIGTKLDANGFAAAIESRQLIVCLGGEAETVARAAALGGLRPERRPVVARLDDLEQLPTEWYGYEGVDALVLSTSQPQRYGKLAPGSPRLEALDQWVQMGGKLVLCVGAEAAAVLGKDAPLARFAPGRYEGMVLLRQTAALEAYCGSSAAALQTGAGRRRSACRGSPA